MRGKPLEFEVTSSGCIVPTSHRLNADGYFRTRDYRVTTPGRKLWNTGSLLDVLVLI